MDGEGWDDIGSMVGGTRQGYRGARQEAGTGARVSCVCRVWLACPSCTRRQQRDAAHGQTGPTTRRERRRRGCDVRFGSRVIVTAAAAMLVSRIARTGPGWRQRGVIQRHRFQLRSFPGHRREHHPGAWPAVQQPGPRRARRRACRVRHLWPASPESAKALRAFDAPGVVRAYRDADLAGYTEATQRLTQLQTLLVDRPDLATSRRSPVTASSRDCHTCRCSPRRRRSRPVPSTSTRRS